MKRFPSMRRLVIGASMVIAGLVSTTLLSNSVHAGFTTCRTDPVVTLSNGRTVTLYADTSTDPSQITQVTYELHVPSGVSVTGVWYDSYGSLESLTVIADRNAHHYSSYTTVSILGSTPVAVTAHMDVSGQSTSDVTGTTGQAIYISM